MYVLCCLSAQELEIKLLVQNHLGNFKPRKESFYFLAPLERKASCRKETTFEFSPPSPQFVFGHQQQKNKKAQRRNSKQQT